MILGVREDAGFGTGGSTALHLVGHSPETVASLSLMAPLVVFPPKGDHILVPYLIMPSAANPP